MKDKINDINVITITFETKISVFEIPEHIMQSNTLCSLSDETKSKYDDSTAHEPKIMCGRNNAINSIWSLSTNFVLPPVA